MIDNFRKIYRTKGVEAALRYADEHWDDIMPDDARQIWQMTGVIVKVFR